MKTAWVGGKNNAPCSCSTKTLIFVSHSNVNTYGTFNPPLKSCAVCIEIRGPSSNVTFYLFAAPSYKLSEKIDVAL